MSEQQDDKPETGVGGDPAANDLAKENVKETAAQEESAPEPVGSGGDALDEALSGAGSEAQPDESGDTPAEAEAEAGGEGEAETPDDPAAEIAALNERLLRTLADGENLRRRTRKEREETAKYAIAGFARDMLTVADNLSRALASLPEETTGDDDPDAALAEGIRLTHRELRAVMERHGIEEVDPMGAKFSPDLHEAMFEIPTADAAPGTVVQVLEIGYVLNQRLLRAAKVAVAKALPEQHERVDTTA